MNISAKQKKITLLLHENGSISSLEEMSHALIFPIKVSRLHLLVHPGFSTDSRACEYSDDAKLLRNQQLFKEYQKKAKLMRKDEVMLAVIHTTPKELIKDFRTQQPYIANLKKLKEILGKRLIALSGRFDIFSDPDFVEESMEIAKRRGFSIDTDVQTIAYGETDLVCVPDATTNFNLSAKLKNKTVIDLTLTNAFFSKPSQQEWIKQYLKQREATGEPFMLKEVSIF